MTKEEFKIICNDWADGEITHKTFDYAIQEFIASEIEAQKGELIRTKACDVCGFHPSVIYITSLGTFCYKHVKYI